MDKSTLKHYAEAMFSIARETGKIQEFLDELGFVCDVFKSNPDLIRLLDSPMVSYEEKDRILREAFDSRVSVQVNGFLRVLIKRKAIRHFEIIYKQYRHCYNVEMGILEARIYSPYDLSETTVRKLEKIFSDKYGKKVVFRTIIDKRVIAGMKIYVDDTLYDYSVDTKLNNIRDSLVYKESL